MCRYNHTLIPVPDTRVESISQKFIFSRIFAYHKELNLTQIQITQLLAIVSDYRKKYYSAVAKIIKVRNKIDRLTDAGVPNNKFSIAKRLIDEHCKLFKEHEMLYVEAVSKGRKILSNKQHKKLGEIFAKERRSFISKFPEALHDSLKYAYKLKSTF